MPSEGQVITAMHSAIPNQSEPQRDSERQESKRNMKNSKKIQKKQSAPQRPSSKKSGIGIFSVTFVITLMIMIGIGTISVALDRMESTLHAGTFQVLSFEKQSAVAVSKPVSGKSIQGERYVLTAWNQSYEIDLEKARNGETAEIAADLAAWLPGEWTAFFLTVDKLIAVIEDVVVQFL